MSCFINFHILSFIHFSIVNWYDIILLYMFNEWLMLFQIWHCDSYQYSFSRTLLIWFCSFCCISRPVILKILCSLDRFCALNAAVIYIYFTSFQRVDDDDFGGTWELTKEGFMSSFALFLVSLKKTVLHFYKHTGRVSFGGGGGGGATAPKPHGPYGVPMILIFSHFWRELWMTFMHTVFYRFYSKFFRIHLKPTKHDKISLHVFYITVNQGDFGQICTSFINIFIMMNWIQGFTWGLVRTISEQHIYTQL